MSVLTYSDWWDELSEQFDVVAVDLPNHGGSDADRTVATTIETPVLVLHGERDTFVGIGNSRRLSETLSNSEFHVIPEAAHYAWVDNSEP